MAYQITGAEASISAWNSVEGAFLLASGSAPHKFAFNFSADPIDMTAQGDTARRNRNGLISCEGTISAYYPKTTRALGAGGLVTFASGDVTHVDEWNMAVDYGALDITEQAATAVLYRSFRPGKLGKITGGFSGKVDSGVTPPMPILWTAASAAATFKLMEVGATDPTIAGNIVVNQLSHDADMGQDSLQTKRYSFTGDGAITLASAGGNTHFLPDGVQASPDWPGLGVNTCAMTLTLFSGRTITVPAFVKGWSVNCPVGGLIEVQYQVQGTGIITVV